MSSRPRPTPRNRLPALSEVLKRNTRPPVDLYCYYLFLQREGNEDTLDFWLDVQQHENLCRAYFKDLRKSGRSVKQDWPRYADFARTRGSIYANTTGIRYGDPDDDEEVLGGASHGDQRFGSHSNQSHGHVAEPSWDASEKSPVSGTDEFGNRSTMRTPSPQPGHVGRQGSYPLSPTLKALYPHDDPNHRSQSRNGHRASTQAQPYIPRDSAINRTDLIASAERIYSRYLMPGADKEIYLPPHLRIHQFPLSAATLPAVTHPDYDKEADAQAAVPDMFHAQKEQMYRNMETDSFPRFLRAKAFGNLTPMSAMVRLAIGLVCLWVALSTAFSFIFLNVHKTKRLWVILPFTFAILNLLASQYDLDPILVMMGLSETTPFRTISIREPYVRKLLFKRALFVTFLTAVGVALLTVLFVLVPGRRL